MNTLTIAGNIGKDAEVRTVPSTGKKVCNFSVAVSRRKDDPTTWFDCSIWGDRAEKVVGMLTAGTKITVNGEVSARAHDGKAYLQVFVRDFTLQGSRQGQSQPSNGGYAQQPSQPQGGGYGGNDLDDEIPF